MGNYVQKRFSMRKYLKKLVWLLKIDSKWDCRAPLAQKSLRSVVLPRVDDGQGVDVGMRVTAL
jgi:hypothetical protein